MNGLIELGEFVVNYATAMKRGLDKFAGMLPVLVEQQIDQLAQQRLNTTRETFLGAVKIEMNSYLLVVELDPENFLANAVESGMNPFDMKESHLKSPKAKWGAPDKKSGIRYKYMRIPIGKEKGGPGGKTEKSQALQKKINDVMQTPQFGMRKLKTMIDGTVLESQRVQTLDPDIQGLYRVRKFANVDQFHSNSKPKWGLVMFRTMSEKPFSKGRWEHPGIHPAHIFKDTESWLKENVDAMLDTFIQNEVNKIEF